MKRARGLITLALLAVARPGEAQNTDVSLGIEALARRDVKGAEALFRRATSSPAQSVRSGGFQWLAHLAWKVRGDTAEASRYVDSALVGAHDSSTPNVERAAYQASASEYRGAVANAFLAMVTSADDEHRGKAARAAARYLWDIWERRAHAPGQFIDVVASDSVTKVLRRRVNRTPGRTSDADALIRAAIVDQSAPGLREGLISYYALTDSGMSAAVAGLPPVRVDSLAQRFGRVERGPETFSRQFPAAIVAYYRRVLLGTATKGELLRSIIPIERRAWSAWGLDRATFNPAAFAEQLRSREDLLFEYEPGFPEEVRLAHVAAVRTLPGQSHAFVVELDQVEANGLDAWLLDGAGGRAAWATHDTIYMTRDAFAEAPFRLWLSLGDPASMPAEVLRIYRDSIGDMDRAAKDSLGYFAGVAGRLLRDAGTEILDSLRTVPTLSLTETQSAFVRLVYRSLMQTSVELHEGKHLVDIRTGRRGADADAEFRAKIEEVSHADRPKLAMTAILTPNIGEESPHGQANRRIMVGLDRWLRRNARSISGYDRSVTPLLQLPKLTNAQLRAAFASMRPPN
jgi:hypothetical protein